MGETHQQRYRRKRATHQAATEGTKVCSGCRAELSMLEFSPHPLGISGRQARCRSCEVIRLTKYRHGLTRKQKERIAIEQGGCYICRTTDPGERGWVVDHDHRCCPGEKSCDKCRRKVLCGRCNRALGFANDDAQLLRAMANYLDAHAIPDLGNRSVSDLGNRPR